METVTLAFCGATPLILTTRYSGPEWTRLLLPQVEGSFRLNGTAHHFGKDPGYPIRSFDVVTEGGQRVTRRYALTTDVPKALWDAWRALHATDTLITDKIIFAVEEEANLMAQAA